MAVTFISSKRLRLLLLQAPSVPRQTVYVRLHHSVQRGDARGQLEVAYCATDHIGLSFRQEAAILGRDPDEVHGCQALVYKSQAVKILHRAHALGAHRAVQLLARLAEVDVNNGIMSVGDLPGFEKRLL